MSAPTTSDRSVRLALARSAAYGFVAEGFRWPDPISWQTLTDRARWETWPEFLSQSDERIREPIRLAQERLFSPDPRRSLRLEDLQELYARLFGHTLRGACPAYELEYDTGEVFQRSADLSDIRGFFSAFGLELTEGEHERADHVSVECEFMSVMAAKEAHAMQAGDDEGLETIRGAQSTFLEEHIGRWLPSLARRIAEADPQGFYGALGDFAAAFVQADCRRFDVADGPQMLELRPSDEKEETSQMCAKGGVGEGCPAGIGNGAEPGFGRAED